MLVLAALRLWAQPIPEGLLAEESYTGVGLLYREVWNGEEELVFDSGDRRILVNGKNLTDAERKIYGEGKKVYLQTTLTLPCAADNPGELDYQQYLLGRKITHLASPFSDEISLVPQPFFHPVLWSAKLRSEMKEIVTDALGEEEGSLVVAIMTGETAGLDRAVKEDMQMAGFSHLMAVSGSHVVFFLLPFRKFLGCFPLPLTWRNVLLCFPLFFFAFLTGWTPSVMRAVWMTAYSLLGGALCRHIDARNSWGLSGILQLWGNPTLLYQTGFLLSYGAVLSLLLLGRPCRCAWEWMGMRLGRVSLSFFRREDPPRWIADLEAGVAVNLGLLPLQLLYFNRFSPLGLLLNLFAAPMANFLCLGGYVLYILALFPFTCWLLPLASAVITVPAAGLQALTWPIDWIPPPLSTFLAASPSWMLVFGYYLILWILCRRKNFGTRRRSLVLAVSAVWIVATWLAAPRGVEILFFDVGQGNCALVRLADGTIGLIDGGDGEVNVSQLLFQNGVGRLDFMILTHGHQDHVEGLFRVLEEHPVEQLLLPDLAWDQLGAKLAAEAEKRGVMVSRLTGKASLELGEKAGTLQLYCRNGLRAGTEESDQNNDSLVVEIETLWGKVLFTGDMEAEREAEMAAAGLLSDCTVLAVAHHGSSTGTTEKFIGQTTPEYAIISVGEKNSYGHPDAAVLERLEKWGGKVYRTDEDGAVRIRLGTNWWTGERTISLWQKRKS